MQKDRQAGRREGKRNSGMEKERERERERYLDEQFRLQCVKYEISVCSLV